MEELRHVEKQWRIKGKEWIAVAQHVVGRPARPQEPIFQPLVKLHQPKQVVLGIVSAQEIAGREQRRPGKQGKQKEKQKRRTAGQGGDETDGLVGLRKVVVRLAGGSCALASR